MTTTVEQYKEIAPNLEEGDWRALDYQAFGTIWFDQELEVGPDVKARLCLIVYPDTIEYGVSARTKFDGAYRMLYRGASGKLIPGLMDQAFAAIPGLLTELQRKAEERQAELEREYGK